MSELDTGEFFAAVVRDLDRRGSEYTDLLEGEDLKWCDRERGLEEQGVVSAIAMSRLTRLSTRYKRRGNFDYGHVRKGVKAFAQRSLPIRDGVSRGFVNERDYCLWNGQIASDDFVVMQCYCTRWGMYVYSGLW